MLVVPNIILDPMSDPRILVADTPSYTGYSEIHQTLCYFDGVVILKEDAGPAVIRVGERGRRLSIFSSDADQNYLAENGKAWGHYSRSDMTLLEACVEAQRGFRRERESLNLGDVIIPNRILEFERGMEYVLSCSFMDSLPVPRPNASFQDILEFKASNYSALEDFWKAIYDIAENVSALIGDSPEQKVRAILDGRLEKYRDLSSRSWGQRVLASAQFRLSIDGKTAAALASAVAVGNIANIPIVEFALGAIGLVKFSIDPLAKPQKMPDEVQAFGYAFSVPKI